MKLEEQAEALPLVPGVYLFKDAQGTVLYVGKAISLKNRVKQYIQGHDERAMVRYLVAAARRIDVVPVKTEREALLLESTLIRQYKPRYNSQLRDDKSFLQIRIDLKSKWPRFTLARTLDGPPPDGVKSFGPYYSPATARKTVQFIHQNFALRTCTDSVLNSRKRPCLLYQLKRCSAPCVGKISPESYSELVVGGLQLLSGRSRELLSVVENRMQVAASAEEFEEAARYRDLARALAAAVERQSVVDVRQGDRDVWGIYREGDSGVLACMPVREGLARDPQIFPFEGEPGDSSEVLSSFLNLLYGTLSVPPEVLVPVELSEALEELLSERRGSKVRLWAPKAGDKQKLLELAAESAATHWQVHTSEQDRLSWALEGIAELCGLQAPPRRMECFDNSNLLGENPVASRVVFIDGKPDRSEYRRYKVKTVVGADDFATMREILFRRLRRGMEEGDLPDLLVVDGGRGQLNVAVSVISELGLEQPVIGVVKPRTDRKRGDLDATDRIVLPFQAEPVALRYDHPSLRMLQYLRDEAHKEAVGFHRVQRSKAKLRSALDDIPGLGATRKKALLTQFGSVAGIRAASIEALCTVPGVGTRLAQTVLNSLNKQVSGS
jgi:excinuclease ABC subunit C